ncbi:hypothetical protein D3C80_1939730 [compost metagenome]
MMGCPATGKNGLGRSRDNGLNLVPFETPPIRMTALYFADMWNLMMIKKAFVEFFLVYFFGFVHVIKDKGQRHTSQLLLL